MKVAFSYTEDNKARVIASYTDESIVEVDPTELPEPDKIEGKIAQLFIDPIDGRMWYEYANIPMTENERIIAEKQVAMEKENATLKDALAEQDALLMQLLLGGMPL